MSSMLVFLFISLFGFAAAEWSARPPLYALEDAEQHFEDFIKKYERNYADEYEKEARFKIFKGRLEEINRLNENSKHAVFGINHFADHTDEEFRKYTGLKGTNDIDLHEFCPYLTEKDIQGSDAPESFDWRDHNIVTPVKNQLGCGSCYAFSSIGNIESQYAIKYKKMLDLSEQQIVDCDKKDGGCKIGGYMSIVFRYLIEAGGIESEDDYPYTASDNTCTFDASKVKVKLTACHGYNLTSQEKVKQLLYKNGPIAIGITGNGLSFYEKGIVTEENCAGNVLHHAVLLVGYGTENGVPFWIVKNSWGATWGDKGYFKMQRGEGVTSCAMLNSVMASAVVA